MRTRGFGFGIAAAVLAVVSFVAPAGSLYVVWAALLSATIAALLGDRILAVLAVALCAVNVILVNSLVALFGLLAGAEAEQGRVGHPVLLAVTGLLFLAPIVAIVLYATGRSPLASPHRPG